MSVESILNHLGAIITAILGLMGLLFPQVAARFTGLEAKNRTAFAEFRATFGGLFVLMGVLPIVVGSASAFNFVGCLWMGAALGRLVSVCVDQGYKEARNMAGVAFEAGIGMLLLAGSPHFARLSSAAVPAFDAVATVCFRLPFQAAT
jgi:hypothetical protein